MLYPNTLSDAVAFAEEIVTSEYGVTITLSSPTAAEALRNKIYYHKKSFKKKFPDETEAPLARLVTSLAGVELFFIVPLPVVEELTNVRKHEAPARDSVKDAYFRNFSSRLTGKKASAEDKERAYETLCATNYSLGELKEWYAQHGTKLPPPKEVTTGTFPSPQALGLTPIPGESIVYKNFLIRYIVQNMRDGIEQTRPEFFLVDDILACLYEGRFHDPVFDPDETLAGADGASYVSILGIYKELTSRKEAEAEALNFFAQVEDRFGR